MNGTECSKCRQWHLKDNDKYCGYCGSSLTDIDIQPLDITLISGISSEKRVKFNNKGSLDADIRLVCVGTAPDFIRFDANDFSVTARKQKEIILTLDENRLPRDFREEKFNFQCIINNENPKDKNLSVRVRTGPNPLLLTEEIDFGEMNETQVVERTLKLGNKGSVPLALKDITSGSIHLKVGNDTKFPIKILQNKGIGISVLWDSNFYIPENMSQKTGFSLFFGNYKTPVFVPVRGKIVKTGIELNKEEVSFNPALSKQKYSEEITLTNTGNTDIEIKKIESGDNWIRILQESSTFTLLSQDSLDRGVRVSGTADKRYKFTILAVPGGLNSGRHTGTVSVYTSHRDAPFKITVRINVIKPEEYHSYIGIDFGTTNSVIAIHHNGETHAVEIEMAEGKTSSLIPSILLFEGGYDNYKIGWDAKQGAIFYPENTVRSVKRIMGYSNKREFYGKKFSPNELAGCIIKKLVDLAETEYFNMTRNYFDIKHAIVTVPANFFDLQIRGILDACRSAGLDTEEEAVQKMAANLKKRVGKNIQEGIILDEPSAAAIFYLDALYDHPELNEKLDTQGNVNFLVFDYGGGTLDISVVQILRTPDRGIGIKVLANKGDNDIGGDSIDLAVMKKLLPECKKDFPNFDDSLISCNFNDLENRREEEGWDEDTWKTVLGFRNRWKELSEKVKIDLSGQDEIVFSTDILFYIADRTICNISGTYRVTIRRYIFEGWIGGFLSDCRKLAEDALEFAGMKKESMDYILHTGRSSLIPSVRKCIKDIFPHIPAHRDILDESHLKVCVAKGAAMYGAMRRELGGRIYLIADGRRLPHAYGVATLRGMRREFDEVIPLGSMYPTDEVKHYSEDMIRGPLLFLEIYQNSGKNKEISRKNKGIRKISETTEILEELSCDVKFVIDANRKLDVYVNNKPLKIIPAPLEEEGRWVG